MTQNTNNAIAAPFVGHEEPNEKHPKYGAVKIVYHGSTRPESSKVYTFDGDRWVERPLVYAYSIRSEVHWKYPKATVYEYEADPITGKHFSVNGEIQRRSFLSSQVFVEVV